jgi:hypothetical protein
MRLTRYAPAIFIFLIFASSFTSVIAASVGVQPGHWAKYTVTGVGQEHATSITISISSVSGTIVEYALTYEYVNLSPLTQSFRSDVSDGHALPYIVLANLHEGDTIYDDPIFSPKVKGIATRSYAGSSRTVVYATYFGDTYYWDQQTGILVEQTTGIFPMKLTETNIWGGGIFDASTPLFWVLVVVVIVVVAALALVVISSLRKKKTITETVTPSSPPEQKSAKTKYCLKCGTSMPSGSIYCPKCGHKQPQT